MLGERSGGAEDIQGEKEAQLHLIFWLQRQRINKLLSFILRPIRQWEGMRRWWEGLSHFSSLPTILPFFLAFLSLQMPDRCQFLLSLQTHGISATIFPILSTCHRFMCSCLVENEFKICALWSLTECGLYEILKLWPVWIFLWLFVLRFLLTFKQDWI